MKRRRKIIVCRARGCSKPAFTGKIHLRYEADPYCSTVCCRADSGVVDASPTLSVGAAWGTTICGGCGCPMGESTPGCSACKRRRRKRVVAA